MLKQQLLVGFSALLVKNNVFFIKKEKLKLFLSDSLINWKIIDRIITMIVSYSKVKILLAPQIKICFSITHIWISRISKESCALRSITISTLLTICRAGTKPYVDGLYRTAMVPPSPSPSPPASPVGPGGQINSAQHIIDLRLIPFTGIKTET